MNIELKKIHHSIQLSRETEAFTADLYIKNIHAGYAENSGHGGPTDYHHKDEKGRELILEAEAYCKALPPMHYPADKYMEAFSIDMDLEHFIDDLLNKHVEKKEQAKFTAKMNKAMERGIVYGIPGVSFTTLSFSVPFAKVLAHSNATSIIREAVVNKILPDLKDGNIILSTNIPENILKEAGLKQTQYVKPLVQDIGQTNRNTTEDNNQQNIAKGRSR